MEASSLGIYGKCPKVLRATVMSRYGLAACPEDLVSQSFPYYLPLVLPSLTLGQSGLLTWGLD